jgi:hypothetical protein
MAGMISSSGRPFVRGGPEDVTKLKAAAVVRSLH